MGPCIASLNSFHDFRKGFQQLVQHSNHFSNFYDFSYFSASENHEKTLYVESGLEIFIGSKFGFS